MTANLKPYPVYKESGVDWLGKVPEGWEVRRLQNVAGMRVSSVDKHSKVDEVPVRLCNYVDVYKNDRIRASMRFMRATATPEEIDRFRLHTGDVLITKDSESWNDIGVPAIVEEPAEDLVCGYHLALLRPFRNRLLGGYLLCAMQSKGIAYQFHLKANGVTRYGLSHLAIKSIQLSLPPLPEQAAIVRFLNYIDRRTQKYIRAKKKLIKLLEEQKQAIISEAVTGQIDVRTGKPYPAYKDSGVEWLGEIPEYWEVRRLKYTTHRIVGGTTPSSTEPKYWGDDIIWITPADVSNSARLRDSFRRITYAGLRSSSLKLVPPGSIVVTSRAPVGNVSLAEVELCTNQGCKAFIIDNTTMQSEFGLRIFRAMKEELQSLASGTTFTEISTKTLGDVPISLPPLPEQTAIVQFLDEATEKIAAAVDKAHQEIELLTEYRTRLISDVVTGKIDVREIAAQLPDEDEDAELPELDDALNKVIEDVENSLEDDG